jgi:hypothetical protein
MKTINRNMMRQMICATFILLGPTSLVYAYPPDNAAVLYYRACLIYDANDMMTNKVTDFVKGNIGIDKEIKDYVQKNKFAIKYFVDAGDAPNCDWGLDYSEGIELQMPRLAPLRILARIVQAQAKIAADSADYKRALELCLSIHEASPHIADGGVLISHLVGISLNALANQCIMEILPQISDNPDMLIWLKNQIYDVSERSPSVKVSINGDLRICSQDINKEKAEYILKMSGDDIPKDKRKIIRNADEAFFKANKEYFLDYLSTCLTAVDLPYPQSYEQLEKLAKKPANESKKNPDATMSSFLTPALSTILCLDLKVRTQFNAVKTALNLYIIRAKSVQLPDELPADLPKDLFSGKDFEYEKTKDGFVLRCQGKDLSKDKIYEYEFKVKK